MQRTDDHRGDSLIDLGAVTEETKGLAGIREDTVEGQQFGPGGISED